MIEKIKKYRKCPALRTESFQLLFFAQAGYDIPDDVVFGLTTQPNSTDGNKLQADQSCNRRHSISTILASGKDGKF